MKKRSVIISGFLFFAFVSVSTFAQDATPRTDARQHAQRARIADGVRDGEVTRREAVGLRAEQRHIRRSERRVKADGEVTVQERRRLQRKQNRASRHIRRAKHNEIDNN